MDLIRAHHITKKFIVETDWLGRPKTILTAVHDMSLTIHEGETVGLVGESGCGKSTFARTVLGLYAASGGDVFYKEKNNSHDFGGSYITGYRIWQWKLFQSGVCKES